MGKKFKTWNEFKKELDIPRDQEEEIRLEQELMEAFIETKKRLNLSQEGLSKLIGIKPEKLEKIQMQGIQTRIDTLIKILYPMGYTIRIVPLENKDK